jgi:uncharacterized protein (DUF1697 family)
MQTYICLLRGINVSGKNLIKMDILSNLFISLGYQNISTYIQSGNVIFKSTSEENTHFEKEIAEKITQELNLNIPVLVLKKQEFSKVVSNNSFVNDRKEDVTKLHVTFLSELPLASNIEKITEGNFGEDEYVIHEKAVYVFCPNGYGNTKLSNNFFESKLKVMATTRNWKTTNKLIEISKISFQ